MSGKGRGDKMTTGCHQFLKYANILFTFIIFIAGAGILGLGIYILGSDYGAKQMSEILGNDLYQIAAYVLIVAGSVLVLISMCGCCGSLRESKFMLGCFIFAISVLVLVLITAAIIVFVFRQKMEGDVIHSMEDILIEKYGVDLEKNSDNRMITDFWNWLQRELQCCGVTGGLNSTTSWAIYRHAEWYKGFETGKPYVPQSCCKVDGDINLCTGITDFNGPPSLTPPLLGNFDTNSELYTVGCYDELVHYIQSHAIIIGVCSIATVVVMLFGLFFSVYLCRRIDVEYYSY
ncbi:CD151 antigen-like isoform X2 [Ruditapes philippinarum]|uniref:CD151 antigen-like isoform X2 n=1 Tax=Ruditapes philippinarum TaxID=129788 RepID=UPI00295B9288|nr:CD151 antigen-like isoform X2 [Ruditapes philippinarum]